MQDTVPPVNINCGYDEAEFYLSRLNSSIGVLLDLGFSETDSGRYITTKERPLSVSFEPYFELALCFTSQKFDQKLRTQVTVKAVRLFNQTFSDVAFYLKEPHTGPVYKETWEIESFVRGFIRDFSSLAERRTQWSFSNPEFIRQLRELYGTFK